MTDRARELREAFDRGFAEPARDRGAAAIELLQLRVGGEPRVVALSDVAAIHVDLRACPVPSPAKELLGLAVVRAAVVPVYDLRLLLAVAATAPPRWCVVARETGAAFAFDGFAGTVRVAAAPPGGLASIDGRNVPVVDLAALARALAERWSKER